VAQGEADGVVARRVAGVKRAHHVDLAGEADIGDGAGDEAHAVEAASQRQALGRLHQRTARFDGDDFALAFRTEDEVVEDEAQIGLAGAEVGENRRILPLEQAIERRAQQLHEVLHLLQLAARIGVERALAGEDVQRLEQLDRLAGPQVLQRVVLLFSAHLRPRRRRSCAFPRQGIVGTRFAMRGRG
jgi:hypothetical protein